MNSDLSGRSQPLFVLVSPVQNMQFSTLEVRSEEEAAAR